mmetsp:Transcript_27747/g.92219  ORF Transcript_27747/g.92219 Transcript_27747/m.92219 type:complete len:218 (+) Transcript_27747:201-854(+)
MRVSPADAPRSALRSISFFAPSAPAGDFAPPDLVELMPKPLPLFPCWIGPWMSDIRLLERTFRYLSLDTESVWPMPSPMENHSCLRASEAVIRSFGSRTSSCFSRSFGSLDAKFRSGLLKTPSMILSTSSALSGCPNNLTCTSSIGESPVISTKRITPADHTSVAAKYGTAHLCATSSGAMNIVVPQTAPSQLFSVLVANPKSNNTKAESSGLPRKR